MPPIRPSSRRVAQVLWGLAFKTLPDLPAFAAYGERLSQRPAYGAAKAIDNALLAAAAPG